MKCSICLDKIKEKEEFINNECCNNIFHTVCLNQWYKIKENCPLCRNNNEIIQDNTKKINDIFKIFYLLFNNFS